MKKLYKVLKGLQAPYRDFTYEPLKWFKADNFDTHSDTCGRGLYAVDLSGLLYVYEEGDNIWECEVKGKEVEIYPSKRRYEYLRITEELPISEVQKRCKEWSETGPFNLHDLMWPPFQPAGEPTPEIKEQAKNWLVGAVESRFGKPVILVAAELQKMGCPSKYHDTYFSEMRDHVIGVLGDLTGGWAWYYSMELKLQIEHYILSLFNNTEGHESVQLGAKLFLQGFLPFKDGTIYLLEGKKSDRTKLYT